MPRIPATSTRSLLRGSPLPHHLRSPQPSLSLSSSQLRIRPSSPHNHIRAFTTTPTPLSKPLPPRPIIPDADLEEKFLKGSGPGGQKINKTSSAVQLKHLPTGIVVKCQATRSRARNRDTARKLLGERIEELELGDGARTRVKARKKAEKRKSADKKKRRKYRAMGEGRERVGEEESVGSEVEGMDAESEGIDTKDERIGTDSDKGGLHAERKGG